MKKAFIGLTLLGSLVSSTGLAAQCPDGSPPPCRAQPARAPPASAPNSVAVLYFDNVSRDTVDAYIAEGLTEELTARLRQIDRLAVKSRTAVQRFRRTAQDPATLGRALGVAHLVTGSVRRSGSRLRVTVELVRTATGVSLWGDQYDRTDGDLLALQEDIARAVTTAISGRLLPAERASLAVRPTRSREAYDHFLRGNYYLAQGTQRALARSIDEYETAARLDPTFGNAVARIGLAYWEHAMWGWNPAGIPAESIHAHALAAADHAIELDSTSSDAWTVRGVVLAWHDHRYSEARRAFERALALDRRNADTYEQYGSVLRFLGEDSAAVAALRTALALEPERPFTLLILSDVSKVHRRIDESRRLLDSAIALAPGFSYAYAMRALDELWLGDTAPARRDAETAIRFAPPTYTGGAVALALVDLHAGDTTGVRARVERLLQAAPAPDSLRGFNTMFVSMALAALGERDRALGVLKSARDFALFWFWLRWPQFDPIRADPRFQRLVEESRPR